MSISLISLASLYNETLGRPDDALPLLRGLNCGATPATAPARPLVLNNIGPTSTSPGRLPEAQTYSSGRSKSAGSECAGRSRRHAAQSGRDAGEDGTLRPGAAPLPSRPRAAAGRRRQRTKRRVADQSYGIGTIFDAQGRWRGGRQGRSLRGLSGLETARRVARQNALERRGLQPQPRRRRSTTQPAARKRWRSRARVQNANLIAQTLTFEGQATMLGRRQRRSRAGRPGRARRGQGAGSQPRARRTGQRREDGARRAADPGAGGAAGDALAGRRQGRPPLARGRVLDPPRRDAAQARRPPRRKPGGRPGARESRHARVSAVARRRALSARRLPRAQDAEARGSRRRCES